MLIFLLASSTLSFSNNLSIRQGSPKQNDQATRKSSTEDEQPLVPIDPSDLKHLFGAETSQYHDGLTDSDADSTSSDSFDGETRGGSDNGMRHSKNSDHSPEASTSTVANSTNPKSDKNSSANANEEENDDDDDDDDDRLSCISGISDMSGADWKPTAGPYAWVQNQMIKGTDPRVLLKDMISADSVIPDHLDELTLWKIVLNMVAEPPRRKKLSNVNTLEDVVRLIWTSKRIIVLTGAGVSVSCGIPDFRSRDGVYARLAVDFPDLPDPQAMFDIQYFRKDPRPFFKFAKEIYPGQFRPSPCHRFIRCIEKHGRLLRNYTQNIDTLEQVVGINNVVQCHGSFATATCTRPSCRAKVSADEIKESIFAQRIPYCQTCSKDYKEPKRRHSREMPNGSDHSILASPPLDSQEVSANNPRQNKFYQYHQHEPSRTVSICSCNDSTSCECKGDPSNESSSSNTPPNALPNSLSSSNTSSTPAATMRSSLHPKTTEGTTL